ncbi:leucine rich adaptor protein 1-like [Carassius carassius]|uniref:leucine rich adaptor protein 1-like n=1 Tax=Carassius carassius TaxID=217509 RepID=UPI002868E0C6|nr:leucine rich adaptor protein 1-like [Carassius carassius]
MRMKMEDLPDLRDVENKMGRKVPESLIRSFAGEPFRGSETRERTDDLKTLHNKISFLRQQMAHLRSIDVTLMRQLLSINEGIESLRWVLEERGGGASRGGSVTDSLCSLSDGAESERGSCSDGLDGISLGSYLDTLEDEELDRRSPAEQDTLAKPPLRPRVETDEYYCFG